MEIAIPFVGQALNAVDKKGRVSLPADMRTVIERRAALAGKNDLPADSNLLLVAEDEFVPCLVGFDQTEQSRVAAQLREREAARASDGGNPFARGNGSRDFGVFDRIVFDKAGRMVIGARLRDRAGIGDHAFFVGAGAGIEIWNPGRAQEQLSREGNRRLVDILEYLCSEKGVKL